MLAMVYQLHRCRLTVHREQAGSCKGIEFTAQICSRRRFNRRSKSSPEASSAVALLEFLAVAAWARIVAADVFQGVAHRFLVSVAAVRTVDMAVVVIMVVMVMIMIVIAVRAVDMGLLGHRCCSGIKSAAIITPLRVRCT